MLSWPAWHWPPQTETPRVPQEPRAGSFLPPSVPFPDARVTSWPTDSQLAGSCFPCGAQVWGPLCTPFPPTCFSQMGLFCSQWSRARRRPYEPLVAEGGRHSSTRSRPPCSVPKARVRLLPFPPYQGGVESDSRFAPPPHHFLVSLSSTLSFLSLRFIWKMGLSWELKALMLSKEGGAWTFCEGLHKRSLSIRQKPPMCQARLHTDRQWEQHVILTLTAEDLAAKLLSVNVPK